jgi:TRAP-type C4-dicarboxylate transport system substrate-binding protein
MAIQQGNWAKALEDATNGRIHVTFFHAESLVKMPDLFDAVTAGTVDFAMIDANLTPERLAISGVMTLPMLFKNGAQSQQTMWALLQKYQQFRDEYLPNKVIWCQNPSTGDFVGKKPMQTLADLQGIKMAAVTKWEIESLKALGIVPVSMPPTEMYTALERGVVDAASGDFNQAFVWKFYELTKYRTDNVDITVRVSPVIMNSNTYNNLPADIKPIFDQVTDGLRMSKEVGQAYDAFLADSIKAITEYDQKAGNPGIYQLPEDERAKWLEKLLPVRQAWIDEMKAKGIDGEAILKDLMSFAEQYK